MLKTDDTNMKQVTVVKYTGNQNISLWDLKQYETKDLILYMWNGTDLHVWNFFRKWPSAVKHHVQTACKCAAKFYAKSCCAIWTVFERYFLSGHLFAFWPKDLDPRTILLRGFFRDHQTNMLPLLMGSTWDIASCFKKIDFQNVKYVIHLPNLKMLVNERKDEPLYITITVSL